MAQNFLNFNFHDKISNGHIYVAAAFIANFYYCFIIKIQVRVYMKEQLHKTIQLSDRMHATS
jgi:hypothetical protein